MKNIAYNNNTLYVITLVLLSICFFGLPGLDGFLGRDNSILFYSGREMAHGIAPYINSFIIKGPLSSFFVALGVFLSDIFNLNDLYSVRIIFMIISILTVISLFYLGSELFKSKMIGLWGSLSMLAYKGFAWQAGAGPRPKTPLVLFEILALYFLYKKKWFWAGFFGALAALVWQPALLFPFIVCFVAFIGILRKNYRIKSLYLSLTGVATPFLLISIYFIYHGAFANFFDGYLWFHLQNETRLMDNSFLLKKIIVTVIENYKIMSIPIGIGVLMIFSMFFNSIWSRKTGFNTKIPLHYLSIYLSFLLCFGWSLYDFQGYPDFFLLLPFTAIGFAKFINICINYFTGNIRFLSVKMCNIIVTAMLILIPTQVAISNRIRNNLGLLEEQKMIAYEITRNLSEHDKVMSICIPEIMVLSKIKNCQPYNFIDSGVSSRIEYWHPDGLKGWFSDIEKCAPELIILRLPTEKRPFHFYWVYMAWHEKTFANKYTKKIIEFKDNPYIEVYTKIKPAESNK